MCTYIYIYITSSIHIGYVAHMCIATYIHIYIYIYIYNARDDDDGYVERHEQHI